MHRQQLRKKAQRLNSSSFTYRTSGLSISYPKTRIRGSRLLNAARILVLIELTRRLHQAYRQAYDKQAADRLLPQSPAPNNRTGYPSQNAAACAALTQANPTSIRANREYGGLIYTDRAGNYHYTIPRRGGPTGFNPHNVHLARGTSLVGDYHTHGDYSVLGPRGNIVRTGNPGRDSFNSDHFSTTDQTGIASDATGIRGYLGYLGTPSGTFRIYNPRTGRETVLRC